MSGGPEERRVAYLLGLNAETAASLYLKARFYVILDRRFRVGEGEIDIVARHRDTIAFIEVKARPTLDEGLLAVTARGWRRIAQAAEVWMARHPEYADHGWRYDLIVIQPFRPPHHEVDAFRPAW
jgi:putative endonuclease